MFCLPLAAVNSLWSNARFSQIDQNNTLFPCCAFSNKIFIIWAFCFFLLVTSPTYLWSSFFLGVVDTESVSEIGLCSSLECGPDRLFAVLSKKILANIVFAVLLWWGLLHHHQRTSDHRSLLALGKWRTRRFCVVLGWSSGFLVTSPAYFWSSRPCSSLGALVRIERAVEWSSRTPKKRRLT